MCVFGLQPLDLGIVGGGHPVTGSLINIGASGQVTVIGAVVARRVALP